MMPGWFAVTSFGSGNPSGSNLDIFFCGTSSPYSAQMFLYTMLLATWLQHSMYVVSAWILKTTVVCLWGIFVYSAAGVLSCLVAPSFYQSYTQRLLLYCDNQYLTELLHTSLFQLLFVFLSSATPFIVWQYFSLPFPSLCLVSATWGIHLTDHHLGPSSGCFLCSHLNSSWIVALALIHPSPSSFYLV